jgi:uncharacterized protein YoxC
MEVNKWTNRIKNLILDLELNQDLEKKSEILGQLKAHVEDLNKELEKLEEHHTLVVSQLKQEISRLNGL